MGIVDTGDVAHDLGGRIRQPHRIMHRTFVPLLVPLAICAVCTEAAAQPEMRRIGPYVLERVVEDRWIHEGQHPDFVPLIRTRSDIRLSGWADAAGGGRGMELQFGSVEARLSLDASNRPLRVSLNEPWFQYGRYDDERARAESRRRRLRGQGATLSLPAVRVRDVPFVLPSVVLEPGVAWSDTVSHAAEAEGMWERLDGIVHHRVVGDTVVDGRRLPLVVTTAELRYRARELTADAALDTLLEVVRDASGTMHGRAAVDTAAGVRAVGSDSTLLAGTGVLRMGDGPPLVSGIRYDRRQSWLLRDSAAWSVVRDSARAADRRMDTGMLRLPSTPMEERLDAGDAAAIDSLLGAWRDAQNPGERQTIEHMLRLRVRGAPAQQVASRLRALKREAGDTASLVQEALAALGDTGTDLAPYLLPYLDEPGRLWRLGVIPRWDYVALGNRLLGASPIVEPDTARWPCRPAACAAFIAMVDTAREPRLRDAALAGAFVRDPARWWDRVRARADSGSAIARQAVLLGDGVGATWPAAPKLPVPEPGADWRQWLAWLGGSAAWRASHGHALRIHTARTGRDPVQELVREWPAARDSARLVLHIILRGAGALPPSTPEQLAAALPGASAAERRAATDELAATMRQYGRPAGEALAGSLFGTLLEALAADGDAPWTDLDGEPARLPTRVPRPDGLTVYVLADELPPAVTAALPAPFRPIRSEEWEARRLREGGVLVTLGPVTEWDRYATVRTAWTVIERRSADEAPRGYAGGGVVTLIRTTAGWRIASTLSWIT